MGSETIEDIYFDVAVPRINLASVLYRSHMIAHTPRWKTPKSRRSKGILFVGIQRAQ